MTSLALARKLSALPQRVYGVAVRKKFSALLRIEEEFPG
jgi:hypothetical protein